MALARMFELLEFQHTAARRRLPNVRGNIGKMGKVSTHSRPKAAARRCVKLWAKSEVSTHSRPKAAAPLVERLQSAREVSTHSRPKAAA